MEHVKEYGIKILPKLSKRIIDYMPENIYSNSFEDIITYLSNYTGINLSNYKIYKCIKENKTGFKMKWHVDDAQIIKHNKDNDYTDQIKISDKKSLNYSNKKPIYTCIIYFSDFNKDFTGGTLEFVDQIIEPFKGMFVFFDSSEVHRVNLMTSGTRKNYLIKFY